MELIELIIGKLANTLHEHMKMIEESRKGVALAKATKGGDVTAVRESIEVLRLIRARLLDDLKTLNNLEDLGEDKVEDLIALLGYYIEVAYANELKVLLEAREFASVEKDIDDLEALRRKAKIIFSNITSK